MGLRLIAAGAILAALAGFGLWLDGLRDEAAEARELRQELLTLREAYAQQLEAIKADSAARDEAQRGYLDEIAKLRTAAARVPVVRVCQPRADDPVMPAGQAITASAGKATAPAGVLPAGAASDSAGGRDIGPGLARLVDEADEVSAQLRAVLAYLGTDDG